MPHYSLCITPLVRQQGRAIDDRARANNPIQWMERHGDPGSHPLTDPIQIQRQRENRRLVGAAVRPCLPPAPHNQPICYIYTRWPPAGRSVHSAAARDCHVTIARYQCKAGKRPGCTAWRSLRSMGATATRARPPVVQQSPARTHECLMAGGS